MIGNIAHRNVCLMMGVAFLCGLVYCVYDVITTGSSWISLSPVVIADAMFFRMYLNYRKQVKKGNIYGKVNHFK